MIIMAFTFNNSLGTGDIRNAQRLTAGDRAQGLIFTSLFTDAYAANDNDLPEGVTDRHGCWSDMFHNKQRGSFLWTLKREKLSPATLSKAHDICVDALQWLVDTGEVLAFNVEAKKSAANRAAITVFYTDLNGVEQQFNEELTTSEL